MRKQISWFALLTILLLAGCGRQGESTASDAGLRPGPQAPAATIAYNQMLRRDAIRPIYAPEFVAGADATLGDDQLVLGVTLDGEAKAYPINVLNSREMVNDELAGMPILATW
jgi:hypothetical protein